ncbi:NEP1-interacting protein-like 2 isoform X2 [Selaginella moellendorffii]|uniref:NEP1-interacting protein-like 2 isoform X2 n=1 Tax=Selaginella moellendorffii TaxID=88036 RepID=UPI000D1CF105|nr:NEP1-interacting protein-like 2 isoform X2 [Selaginella moellendorffii]XP_024537312.1 NEP1-interacting protein-like 2 isoform X2 [Selaginella moellendorffii]|eukprot:XP_024533855.1 NEP1-interacting protein-like 2 isoform X2 [Selaginella moellendorffii]
MEQGLWVCDSCTFHNAAVQRVCAMCAQLRTTQGMHYFGDLYRASTSAAADAASTAASSTPERSNGFSVCSVPRLVAGALSGALTGMFAIVGALTGAVTGAVAGRATDSGLIRGAGLGAVAGAVLSVEFLEASRAYWHSERSGSRSRASLAEFVEDVLNGRFMHDQVNIDDMTYDELYDMFGPAEGTKGASEACLKELPWHTVTTENCVDGFGDFVCCAICLQELQGGEIARCLPHCQHTYHMDCVDKWLARHGSCPVCRQGI